MVLPQNGASSFPVISPDWARMQSLTGPPAAVPGSRLLPQPLVLTPPLFPAGNALSASPFPRLPDPFASLPAANQNFGSPVLPVLPPAKQAAVPGFRFTSPALPPVAAAPLGPVNQNAQQRLPEGWNPLLNQADFKALPLQPLSQDLFQPGPSGVNMPFGQPLLPQLRLPVAANNNFMPRAAGVTPANDNFGNPSNWSDPANDYFASSASGQTAMPWMLPTPASPEPSFLPEKIEKPMVRLSELPSAPEATAEESLTAKPKPPAGTPAVKPAAAEAGEEAAISPEAEGAEAIAQEIKEIIQEALAADPDTLHKLQAMGLQDKLQNRDAMLNELRANIQDVLKLVPDSIENRVMHAAMNRLNPEYRPLAEKLFQWVRESQTPAGVTAKKNKHVSLLRRVWNWLFDRGSRSKNDIENLEDLLAGSKSKFKLLPHRKSDDFEPLELMI